MTHSRSFVLAPIPQFGATLALLIAAYSTPVLAVFDTPAPASVAPAAPEPAADTADAEQAPRYTCPMHPQVDSDKPGSCPHCGMKLERKKAAEPKRVF